MFIAGNGHHQLELSYLDKRIHETFSHQGGLLSPTIGISDLRMMAVYTEVMKRRPMGQPFHISFKLFFLYISFRLSNHSVDMNVGSDNLC
jgi:hypothetical protein